MRAVLLALPAALMLPAPASGEWSCADATYASELCPWFSEAADGHAALSVPMRWSSGGYPPGSAAGNWNDGIYVIVGLADARQSDADALLADVAYEPHRRRDEARTLTPEVVIVRLGNEDWRTDVPQLLLLAPDRYRWPYTVRENVYRFTFGPELVAAMLAASADAPRNYDGLYGDGVQGVLRLDIHFRDADGGMVSSNDILQIDSGTCETNCQPVLSLAAFAEAYERGLADAGR